MNEAAGSQTSVHVGSFGADYAAMQIRDPLMPSKYAAMGISPSFTASRISWFFNLTGPSMNIDTACSSSLTALNLGGEAILNGQCSMVSPASIQLKFLSLNYAIS